MEYEVYIIGKNWKESFPRVVTDENVLEFPLEYKWN